MVERPVPATTEVLYVSSVPSAAQFDQVARAVKPGVEATTYGMAEASFKFHSLIQRGLLADAGIRMHSVVGRMVSPALHEGGWWSSVIEEPQPGLTVQHLGFPNRRVLKQAWLALAFAAVALRWRVRTRRANERILIVDAAYITALPLVLAVLGAGPIARVAIFADLYSFMAPVEDAGGRSLGRLRSVVRRVAAAIYARFDGFVLLTEQMNDVVNPLGKPHIVVEGVVDSRALELDNALEKKSSTPCVLYAGALRRQYGVADLVAGFTGLGDVDAELHVYGAGDYAAEVERAAQENPRIVFHGQVPLDQVVAEELRAWLLVNPRPASAEFTRYSFPSKNMEYLASGTAVLTTRLPGMPLDYYAHVRTIDADGAEAITEALRSALNTPIAELHRGGLQARAWVQAHKNEVAQAGRIREFAGGLRG